MNELKNFKERKLAEFDKEISKLCWPASIAFAKQFISDLIDEMIELNHPFFKADMETWEITELEPGKIETLTNLNS